MLPVVRVVRKVSATGQHEINIFMICSIFLFRKHFSAVPYLFRWTKPSVRFNRVSMWNRTMLGSLEAVGCVTFHKDNLQLSLWKMTQRSAQSGIRPHCKNIEYHHQQQPGITNSLFHEHGCTRFAAIVQFKFPKCIVFLSSTLLLLSNDIRVFPDANRKWFTFLELSQSMETVKCFFSCGVDGSSGNWFKYALACFKNVRVAL